MAVLVKEATVCHWWFSTHATGRHRQLQRGALTPSSSQGTESFAQKPLAKAHPGQGSPSGGTLPVK